MSVLIQHIFRIICCTQDITISLGAISIGAAHMRKSGSEHRRMIRLLLTAFLVTASATAGYYWGTYTSNNFAHQSDFLLAGFALVLCAILASAVLDFIHTRIDDNSDVDVRELERLARTRGTEDLAVRDMHRVMDELTKENLRLMEQLAQRNHHPH